MKHAPLIWKLVFGFVLCLYGCGPKDSGQRDATPPPVFPLITTRDKPVVYELADPGCQDRKELVNSPLPITQTWVTKASGLELLQEQVSLIQTETRASLQNDAVSSTTYGETYQRVCDFRKPKQARCSDANGREIPFYRQGAQGPLPLKICRDSHQYPGDTYEGAALTAAYHLGQTRQFYVMAAPESPPPPKVTLSIFPIFMENYDYFPQLNKTPGRLVTYMTHNLAYFSESEEVVVFPETVTSTSKHRLWESPFVLSHEYGHHLDHVRHKNAYSQAGLVWNVRSHRFTDLQTGPTAAAQGTIPLSMTAKSLLATAMSEAFADLIAFYTQGESSASILAFVEIGTDRDVSNSVFANGLEKALKQTYINTFFNQFDAKPSAADLGMLTGVHSVGAIIAYGSNQLFSTLTIDSDGHREASGAFRRQTLAKYRLLLTFMDSFTVEISRLDYKSSTNEVLAALSKALQAAINQGIPPLKSKQDLDQWEETKRRLCEQLGQNFPGLSNEGFNVEDPC